MAEIRDFCLLRHSCASDSMVAMLFAGLVEEKGTAQMRMGLKEGVQNALPLLPLVWMWRRAQCIRQYLMCSC